MEAERASPHVLEQWWQNVDGLGTTIDAWMAQAWLRAAVFGHAVILLDRPMATAQTAADAPAPYLRLYTPLDLIDWLVDDAGKLLSVRLLESVPRATYDATEGSQVREITPEGWRVIERDQVGRLGDVTAEGAHDYQGELPIVVLYGKRRPLSTLIGQSILGDPAVYVDDYNLSSEIRELLRKQTFGILNIPLGTGPDAVQPDQAKAMLGESSGTINVAFTPAAAQYLSPDSANVTIYQAEREEVRRTMFRLAGLPWEGDSRDAEAADSRRIKREDLNQTLARYADEVQTAERAIAQLFFRAHFGSRWQVEWKADTPVVSYPDTFDSEVLDDLITRAQLAMGLRLGKTAGDLIKASVVEKLLPNLDETTKNAIQAEIAAMPDPEEERRERLSMMGEALKAGAARPADMSDGGGDA